MASTSFARTDTLRALAGQLATRKTALGDALTEKGKWPFTLVSPIGEATLFTGEELKIGGVTKQALDALIHVRPLLLLALAAFQRLHDQKTANAIRKLLSEQALQETWAKEIRDSGFLSLNRHLLIASWSALEAALEDTAIGLLQNDKSAFDGLIALGVKPPKDCAFPPDDFDARRMFKNAWGTGPKELSFSVRFDRIFSSLGLSLALAADLASRLDEVNAVRNLLLHRQGKVDQLAADRVPALAPLVGSVVSITFDRWREYNTAMTQLNVCLHRSLAAYIKGVACAV